MLFHDARKYEYQEYQIVHFFGHSTKFKKKWVILPTKILFSAAQMNNNKKCEACSTREVVGKDVRSCREPKGRITRGIG